MKAFEENKIEFMTVNDQTKPSTLRQLDEKALNGNHKILIVTEASQMRGTDFRSPIHGICLIVAKSFESNRDAEQALARVGRFDDKCERLLLSGVPLVDQKLYEPMLANLTKFRLSLKTKRQIAPT